MKRMLMVLFACALLIGVWNGQSDARETITLISDAGTRVVETGRGAYEVGYVPNNQWVVWNRSLIDNPQGTRYIWSSTNVTWDEANNGAIRTFRKTFTIPEGAKNITGQIKMTADDGFWVKLNGQEVGQGWDFHNLFTFSFTPRVGANTLDIVVSNGSAWKVLSSPLDNPAGTIYRATINYDHPADLWIEDTPPDSGQEPNTSGQDMWLSRSIWIRNSGDGGTEHQNPLYGETNQVYVKIRNRGGVASRPGAVLKVYYANASAGLSWPDNWFAVGEVSLPSIAPSNSQTYIASLPWSPPGQGHYCMIARIESSEDPMTYPETSNLGRNVANNNNIAWRNLNVTGPSCEDSSMLIRNISCNSGEYDETVDLVFEGDDGLFQEGVKVIVDLGSLVGKFSLFTKGYHPWLPVTPDPIPSNVEFIGLESIGGTRYQLLSPQAKIAGIPMAPEDAAKITVSVQIPHKFPTSGKSYHLNIKQVQCDQVIGGVEYDMEPCLTECPEITLNPVTIPCLPPDGSSVAIHEQLSAEGGKDPYIFTLVEGELPPGLSLSPEGVLFGTLSREAEGMYSFSVIAADANGCQGTRGYTLELYSCDLSFRGLNFYEDGQSYNDWSKLPDYVDYTGFDATTGQGTISVKYAPGSTGQHSLLWDFSYLFESAAPECFEFSQENEGALDAEYGQSLSFEMDDNYQVSALLGFDFLIEEANTWAELSFSIGDIVGNAFSTFFYSDPSDNSGLCQGELAISSAAKTGQVPEPSTMLLLASGLIGIVALWRERFIR